MVTDVGLVVANNTLSLGLVSPREPELASELRHLQGVYLFSENEGTLSAAADQKLSVGPRGVSFIVATQGGPVPASDQAFVIKFADGHAWRIMAAIKPLPLGTFDFGAPSRLESHSGALSKGQTVPISIALLFAFFGGLILNLMPCVFPVLSMKLLALTRAGHDTGLARLEALIYGVGVIVTFVALSLVLTLLRAAGASLGWGFQLQSPIVTAVLSLLMFLVGLNMSGAFEVGGTLQSAAGGRTLGKNPYLAAFFTGILAVVVAAPCSAPFMATAMGVALAQGGWTSVGIFTSLGLGFAAPFIVLTFAITLVPALGRLMPRPGAWMNRLRHWLAIPMYLAALWMIWVFAQQTSPLGVCLLVGGMALVGLSIVSLTMSRLVRGSAWFIAVLLLSTSVFQKPEASPKSNEVLAFSPQQIAIWRARNQPVFVDLTAAWCVTCKVNEKVALSSSKVKAALATTHTVYLVGDWTNQDTAISDYIHQFGRSGVPLYVYYGAGGQAPVVLPQLLTADGVVKVLQSGTSLKPDGS